MKGMRFGNDVTATRQIAFINTAHGICHYCLLILPTAVLAMAVPGRPFGRSTGRSWRWRPGMFVLYGVLSLPQGWLAARVGRKTLIRVLPRHRAFADRVRARRVAAPVGARVGGDGRVRRHLPPDRHRDAGRSGRRPARPGHRHQRRVRQFRRGAGPGRHRLPGQRFGWHAAFFVPGVALHAGRRRLAVRARARLRVRRSTRPVPGNSRATSSAGQSSCCC